MDNNPDSTNRRQFLIRAGAGAATLLAGSSALLSCTPARSVSHIQGSINGANHQVGHKLRSIPDLTKLPIKEKILTDVLIVGGGVAGLSARRWLQKQGVRDVLLLEMASQTGGNAAYGQNDVSAYPLGAHYLPIPDIRNKDLLQFLQECNVITGYDDQKYPVYNEYFLCHDPEERLYINGLWQEGLVPDTGLTKEDKQQTSRFFALVDQLKQVKGADGRDAFAIPLDQSSADEHFRALDAISFASYLTQEGFTSPYLRWYLNYSCRDDYGATLANTSAWAGLHYFASRKGKAANASASSVLTWPQGNGFLADHLRKQADSPIRANLLVYGMEFWDSAVTVRVYDALANQNLVVQANRVILATPQFITQRLLHSVASERSALAGFQYAPWLVANLTVSGLPQGRGLPLCWDNVLYNTASVGYINANQQNLQDSSQKVITYYKPLTDTSPDVARQAAYTTTYEQWLSQILDELELAHPGVTVYVSQADIWLWGHGMISPSPGFIWGNERRKAAQPLDNRVFFAHSDLSGISIFEEAFYQGIRAAQEVVGSV
ncbi:MULTISPECIES: NAD(P)-binding protein [unclassified Spirosoma]|uniref:NAD(P)-binding protein n=1 Tax=unclassified Spirosoma TaxID=2621999 RepID=UPI0009662306|nr:MULTISPECIES: NAD(P)-binding protein [unclassified Spirosoma]MBN8826213.1 NAD(P)-binding protein [Spirosoma sp.]OJW76892.1 MAG: FAD-dependent oxidoreductase [Spirosoma sp. 48-14]